MSMHTDSRPLPRISSGPMGRALYLSDLVRWLMRKHEATRVRVVTEHLCPVLAAHAPALYEVRSGGDAALLPDREWFQSASGNPEQANAGRRRVIDRGMGRPLEPVSMAASLGHGVSGAVRWLQGFWGNPANTDAITLDNWHETPFARLAVSEADARRCWGWVPDSVAAASAEPATAFPLASWAELVTYRSNNTKSGRAPSWALGNQIDVGKLELKRRKDAGATASDAMNAMGVALGMKATAGRTVLKRALFGERKRGNAKQEAQTSALQSTKVKDGKKAA